MKRKRGRPKLPKHKARKVFPLRVSDEERANMERAAKRAGKKLSEWARDRLLSA